MKQSSRNVILLLLIAVFAYFFILLLKNRISKKNKIALVYPSIAVLPFKNLDADSLRYFSDGFSEEIGSALGQLKGLKVSAPYSSASLSSDTISLKEIAHRLEIGLVLKGTVQHVGDDVRITARLLNAEDSAEFWSEEYKRPKQEAMAIQNEIALAVAGKLEQTLRAHEQPFNLKKSTENLEAYEFYLKGRRSWSIRTSAELNRGIDYFQKAIAIDTQYARAYAGMADCYTALGYGSFISPDRAFSEAYKAATRAIALDSTLAEPHSTLGYHHFYYDWDWAAAEQEFRKSIALDSNYALAYDWYGYYLTAMKRYDQAMKMFEKALSLDPLSVLITTDMGFSAYYGRDYKTASRELNTAIGMNSKNGLANIWLGRVHEINKEYPEAIRYYQRALDVAPDWSVALAAIGHAYGEMGNNQKANQLLDSMLSLKNRKFVTAYGVALVYTSLKDKDRAFQWLGKAYAEKSNWLVWLKSDPRWWPLRSDKRFTALANSMLLPD